ALVDAGATLTLVSRNEEKLNAMARQFAELGAEGVHVLALDLEDGVAIDSLVTQHIAEHGHIQILINNAGGPPGGPLLDAGDEDFFKPLTRHLFASHRLVKACLEGMISSDYGRIINIVSTSVKEPIPNLGVSNTIRGAMASWAKTLSRELPECVSINNVLPGFTDTARLTSLSEQLAEIRGVSTEEIRADWLDEVPAGRLIDPSETAAAIAFLCSPAGGAIRGVSLAVDGGRLRSI
ncbi:MAG: SDR family oxidoreductase, partial [Pseudomonadales bacterium]|nr:SDR family oxidoreductase [Pseudomonadales bacterium]